MALDVKTLRIGSHILVDGKRERVRGMDEDNGLIVRFPAEYVMANEVEPILLDPDILTELGFKKGMSSAIGFDSWYCDMMRIDNNVMQAHPWWFYNQVKLRYLHELESLYYMLCGVELIKE